MDVSASDARDCLHPLPACGHLRFPLGSKNDSVRLTACLPCVQGGHYVSYVKCKDAWYLCDDSAVFQVDELTACCPSAYMLFYRQLAIHA